MSLVAKPKSTSPVWTYFGFEADEDGKAKSDEVAIWKGSNTSNLFSHLRVHHPLKFAEVQQAQKQKANTERSRSNCYCSELDGRS